MIASTASTTPAFFPAPGKRRRRPGLPLACALLLAGAAIGTAGAATLTVTGTDNKPLATVMVREIVAERPSSDKSDNGYPAPGKTQRVPSDITRFTDAQGRASWPDRGVAVKYLLRKPGYRDLTLDVATGQPLAMAAMEPETDPFKLAEAKPSNVWMGALDLGDAERKQHFQLQCGFCHQQGNAFIRRDRAPEEWSDTIHRMARYGSRLSTADQEALPGLLNATWTQLRARPDLLAEPAPWDPALASTTITEWTIGDHYSQTHDQLLGLDGKVYIADNIQDRVWQVDPATDAVTVYKIPHLEGDDPGGLIAARLKDFPKHDSSSNAHSLAQSMRDGHIFITPSAQQRLVEFDPKSGEFKLHEIGGGFYPHTIRIDAQDRVWFTLALSNQIGMFDRASQRFTLYDLPTRGVREWLTVTAIRPLFKLMSWGLPLANWLPVDRMATGTPLPYGIDITPDGKVWFARLHTDEIGRLDPDTGDITMIKTPFGGPRRLRTDAEGRLWIVSFAESAIARYDPASDSFQRYDLPVIPKGSETPYALNVDKQRHIVWVTGNQSDALYAFDMGTETWRHIPLPRRVAFTRDVEIAEDGTIYTSTSSFPSWHVEDAQPTMIRVQTGPAPAPASANASPAAPVPTPAPTLVSKK